MKKIHIVNGKKAHLSQIRKSWTFLNIYVKVRLRKSWTFYVVYDNIIT